jgi:hypothetical protein
MNRKSAVAEEYSAALYDADFFEWTQQTAVLLREGRFGEVDVAHVAEEIEDMGKSEFRELKNRMAVLVAHMLKRDHQPQKRTRSWDLTIKEERLRLHDLLAEMPSLRAKLPRDAKSFYRLARVLAAKESGMEEDEFPPSCPYTVPEILSEPS